MRCMINHYPTDSLGPAYAHARYLPPLSAALLFGIVIIGNLDVYNPGRFTCSSISLDLLVGMQRPFSYTKLKKLMIGEGDTSRVRKLVPKNPLDSDLSCIS